MDASVDDYTIGVLTNIGLFSFVALSAYLLLVAGEMSFGQQAFFGVGAYSGGMLTALFGWPLPLAALAAMNALEAAESLEAEDGIEALPWVRAGASIVLCVAGRSSRPLRLRRGRHNSRTASAMWSLSYTRASEMDRRGIPGFRSTLKGSVQH